MFIHLPRCPTNIKGCQTRGLPACKLNLKRLARSPNSHEIRVERTHGVRSGGREPSTGGRARRKVALFINYVAAGSSVSGGDFGAGGLGGGWNRRRCER